MKTKTWAALIAGLLVICLGISAWILWPRENAAYAQVWSEGKLLYTLDLHVDRVVTVTTATGRNVITVKDGRIGVTEADCPDGYCMKRGFCSSGAHILCLPNRLEIRFIGGSELDGVTG